MVDSDITVLIINYLESIIHSYCLSITNNLMETSKSISCSDGVNNRGGSNMVLANGDILAVNNYHSNIIIDIKGDFSGIQYIDIVSYDDMNRIINISLSNRYFITAINTKNSKVDIHLYMNIVSPSSGSLIYDILNITLDGSYDIYFDVKGITSHHMVNLMSIHSFDGLSVDPGTWVMTITPTISRKYYDILSLSSHQSHSLQSSSLPSLSSSEEILYGYPTHHYIEFVLSEEKIHNLRRYYNEINDSHYRQSLSSLNDNYSNISQYNSSSNEVVDSVFYVHTANNSNINNSNGDSCNKNNYDDHDNSNYVDHDDNNDVDSGKKLNVCIFSNNVMDGQKTIWLQQSQYMYQYDNSIRFTWFLDIYDENPVMLALLKISNRSGSSFNSSINDNYRDNYNHTPISIKQGPVLTLSQHDLHAKPDDGREAVINIWNNNITIVYKYIYDSLIIANGNINQVTPLWCREFYLLLSNEFINEDCSVVVYGNPRHFNIYSLVISVADTLHIPSITELCNHYLNEYMIPDAIVSPSIHAIEHDGLIVHPSRTTTDTTQATANTTTNHVKKKIHQSRDPTISRHE